MRVFIGTRHGRPVGRISKFSLLFTLLNALGRRR